MAPSQIELAVDLLSTNEVVCIPTETVYGLAASLYSEKAIDKIYALKGRPRTNPLIVHIGRKEDLAPLCIEVPAPLQRPLVLPRAARALEGGLRAAVQGLAELGKVLGRLHEGRRELRGLVKLGARVQHLLGAHQHVHTRRQLVGLV